MVLNASEVDEQTLGLSLGKKCANEENGKTLIPRYLRRSGRTKDLAPIEKSERANEKSLL